MENLFVRDEGRVYQHGSFTQANPPVGYVVIGAHRTGGGGHRYYAYGRINSVGPNELADFCRNHPQLFGGGMPHFKARGRDLHIFTLSPGGWIGKGGIWVKGLSRCLKAGGRVEIKSLESMVVRGDFLPSHFTSLSEDNPVVQAFAAEAAKRVVSRGQAGRVAGHIVSDDVVTFKPGEWFDSWLKRLEEANRRAEEEYRALQKRGEEIVGHTREFAYFDMPERAAKIARDEDYFRWAIGTARKISQLIKDRVGIWEEEIYVGELGEDTLRALQEGLKGEGRVYKKSNWGGATLYVVRRE